MDLELIPKSYSLGRALESETGYPQTDLTPGFYAILGYGGPMGPSSILGKSGKRVLLRLPYGRISSNRSPGLREIASWSAGLFSMIDFV